MGQGQPLELSAPVSPVTHCHVLGDRPQGRDFSLNWSCRTRRRGCCVCPPGRKGLCECWAGCRSLPCSPSPHPAGPGVSGSLGGGGWQHLSRVTPGHVLSQQNRCDMPVGASAPLGTPRCRDGHFLGGSASEFTVAAGSGCDTGRDQAGSSSSSPADAQGPPSVRSRLASGTHTIPSPLPSLPPSCAPPRPAPPASTGPFCKSKPTASRPLQSRRSRCARAGFRNTCLTEAVLVVLFSPGAGGTRCTSAPSLTLLLLGRACCCHLTLAGG